MCCEDPCDRERVHGEYEGFANGKVQIGSLPGWMHVNGRVARYVFQGPYSQLPQAWMDFETVEVLHPFPCAGAISLSLTNNNEAGGS
jgi:hypothetical protein